jgi:hypothetical protein
MRQLITQTQPPIFTLEPLLVDGRKSLACLDVEGMEKTVLKRIEFYHGGKPWHHTIHEGEDIFTLAEEGLYTWPPLEQLLEAEFAVWTKGSPHAHRLIIRFPDKATARQARDTVPPGTPNTFWSIAETWMKKRRFMNPQCHGKQPAPLA